MDFAFGSKNPTDVSQLVPLGMEVSISNASWNTEIAPIASSQGWIFAPYIYENNTVDLLINESKRSEILDQFRNWIFDLQLRFEKYSISVIAHSFGTYILAVYLSKFETPPVCFNSIILTGSIINTSFDWNNYKGKGVVRVRNEIAPNDQWVKFLPNKWDRFLQSNSLLGRSGTEGFEINSSILTQHNNDIFNPNNVIKRDIIYRKWLPYLNANRFAIYDPF